MTRLAVLAASLLLVLPFSSLCLADAPPATGPKLIDAPPRVIVYPFTSVGDVGAYAWIGNGIQQSLLVEASRPGFVAMSVSSTQPDDTGADPIAAAAKAGASIAVFGSYQILDGNLRCTGQVVDTASGQSLGSLSATGMVKELFKLEDSLGQQLRHALQPAGAAVAATTPPNPRYETAPQPADTYAPVASANSGYYYNSPNDSYVPASYYVPDYTTAAYGYPYYGYYGYPYYSYYPYSASFIFSSGRCFNNNNCFVGRRFNCNTGSIHFGNTFCNTRGSVGFVSRAPLTRFNNFGGASPVFARGPSSFGGARGPVMQPGTFRGTGGAAFGGGGASFGGGGRSAMMMGGGGGVRR